MVVTEDQAETDRYWNAIVGNGGAGKRVRLVQGQMGLFVADHAARAARRHDQLRQGRRQARVRRDDDDAQDRRRQDRSGARAARPPMRKIVGAAFVSLDGVMQAPGGPRRIRPAVSSMAAGCRRSSTRTSGEAIGACSAPLRPAAGPANLRHFRRLLAPRRRRQRPIGDDVQRTAPNMSLTASTTSRSRGRTADRVARDRQTLPRRARDKATDPTC